MGHFASKDTDQRAAIAVGLVGFGLTWLAIGVGELVTGHAWQNIVDRNEGPHRDDNPKRFWGSVALAVGVCIASCAFALYKYHVKRGRTNH